MDLQHLQPSLEERIREARAQRSIAIGEAIGDALDALWRVLSSLPFSPSARVRRSAQPHRLGSRLGGNVPTVEGRG
jgi:hypothetical protein